MHARRDAVLDAFGAGLLVASGAWMVWARLKSGGSAAPGVTLLAACGLAMAASRAFPIGVRLVVPASALVVAGVLTAGSEWSPVSPDPSAGLFGYSNAEGAFYVQTAFAGLMVACAGRTWSIRAAGGVGAGVFTVLPFVVHAAAASTLVLLLPAVSLGSYALAGARGARVSIALLGALFFAALAASIALGATYSPGGQPSDLQRTASSRIDRERLALWHEALAIMGDHPLTGVGPGRYQEVSPIGSRDPDSRWAHNEFLQQGAEGGIPGLLLLVALFGWGFARLWAVDRPGILAALSAASLAALGIHASVDYVMHFPAIPITAAAMVATGMMDGRDRSPGSRRESKREEIAQTRPES
jgi:O-antigen ligase